MADEGGGMDVRLLKRTRISVHVDEALPDILVVSYEYGVKIFKGVLLDSTKRNLPCGVQSLNPAFSIPAPPKPDDDVLYSVSQRFAYAEPGAAKKITAKQMAKYKNSKMTVRLRPRQVLCSKCKGICNENSENVSKKRKTTAESGSHPPPPIKRGANAPMTRSVYSEQMNNNKKKEGTNNSGARSLELQPSLIPKISRLLPQEISNALSGNVNKLNIIDAGVGGNVNKKQPLVSSANKYESGDADTENHNSKTSTHSADLSSPDHCHDDLMKDVVLKQGQARRVLRKKRSVGSMEDLWDESCFEENNAKSDAPLNNVCVNTRTIKISYGPQGEGTVLKIPAHIENLNLGGDAPSGDDEDDFSEENLNLEEQQKKQPKIMNKAARRALKRAKKEARRKILLSGNSPCYLGSSPRYLMGGSSPRYALGAGGNNSPRQLGNNSPRYLGYEINAPRRRKHKVKHKKKHKDEKERKHNKEGEVLSGKNSSTEEPS